MLNKIRNGGITMEIAGVSFHEFVTTIGDTAESIKSINDIFRICREGLASRKIKNTDQISATITNGEELLAQLNQRILKINALCAMAQDRGNTLADELSKAKIENNALAEKLRTFDTFGKTSKSFVEVGLTNHSVAVRQETPLGGKKSIAYYCPNCFNARKYTILSFKEHVIHADKLECNECSTTAFVHRAY